MSKTFTEQGYLPNSTVTWDSDGEGMHSLLPYDFVRGLNNLGTYVNPHAHFVADALGGASTLVASVNGREYMFIQVPLYIPLWATRVVWTVGAHCTLVSLASVTVYLAKDPYITTGATPFSSANLTAGFKSSTKTLSLTPGTYGLADDSSTGFTSLTDCSRAATTAPKGKRLTYAIVTAIGGAVASFEIVDCSFWCLPS
jgi:hypothetical protein